MTVEADGGERVLAVIDQLQTLAQDIRKALINGDSERLAERLKVQKQCLKGLEQMEGLDGIDPLSEGSEVLAEKLWQLQQANRLNQRLSQRFFQGVDNTLSGGKPSGVYQPDGRLKRQPVDRGEAFFR